MAQSYQSIRVILDKALRHPLLQDVTFEAAVDYAVEFMRIVGCPAMFSDKVATLKIDNYRAALPCDFYEMNQVRAAKSKVCYRYATDSFHLSQRENIDKDSTYKIQGNIIYTSRKDEDIEISYRAIEIDEEGLPMIPENSSFERALELYIKKKVFTVLFDLGKISQVVYNNTQQEYAWAVGDCQNEFVRMSLDKAESFFNSWRTLLIRDTSHKDGFINDGAKEHLRVV